MTDARESYLESQVMTATPQKLRLMLIDGALRFLTAAQAELDGDARPDVVSEMLTRGRAVISELLSSVRGDNDEVGKQLVSLYLYLFQTLTEVQLQHRTEKLPEVLGILEIERETWRQVCEQHPHAPDAEERQRSRGREILAAGPAIPPGSNAATTIPGIAEPPRPGGGFSVDA